ncbi:hypothetical protein CAG54_00400 [Vibrio sp. V27_P1S3P104]|uniref:hypothetical protein n=1 Tax=unclassified Vibrio TaxID=2614977 RepID=UPI001372ED44|nr:MULTISPECIES: hypothetical protein [unclassified Vibrio]NAX34115.1 hypothetical protein [Vibrio sp. V29_P1S30P107]NAX35985.1 hypothetical protein [Vibrio sp. V27_P1S3P104]
MANIANTPKRYQRETHFTNDSAISICVWTDQMIHEFQYGMIKSAINDIQDGRKSKRMRQEATRWLLDDDYVHPLSFCNCCRSLDLDAEYLRTMLSRLLEGRFQYESI